MSVAINDRIDIRISKEQKELIQYAAALSGFKSVSEFIVSYISGKAKEVIAENDLILKSIEDKKIFVNALINPPAPNAALKKSYKNYKKLK